MLDVRSAGGLCGIRCQIREYLHVCDIWGDGREGGHDAVNYERVDEAQPKRPRIMAFI